MKKIIIPVLLFTSLAVHAQKPLKTDTVRVDSVIQPGPFTPLLCYADIKFLHDSVVANMPYSYSPALNTIFEWLQERLHVRGELYIAQQKQAPVGKKEVKKP